LTVSAPGVLANDLDLDSPSITAVLVTGPSNGNLTLNPNGSFAYTPAANYNGSDSFTYRPNDGIANGNIVTVALTVTPVNDAPVASNDSYSTNEDTALTISTPGVLANDTDVDGNSLTAALVAGPSHGTLTLNPNGSFLYTPAANYNGSDSFTYRANDGTTNSNIATVSLTITSVNDAPVATNDSYSTNEDTALTISTPGVLANDTDIDGDALSAVVATGPTHGALTLNPNGSFLYTPAGNYNGSDSFTYRANDGTTNSNIATVALTITSVNDAPVATNDSYSTNQDIQLNVNSPGVLANDNDVDGDALSAVLATAPAHGTVSLNTNGSFTYTPTAGYIGSDGFTYKANDGAANSNIATVAITVAANHAPVATNDSYSTNEDNPLTVSAPGVLTNDTDADGNTLTANLVTGPAHGSLTLNANGSFTYTPSANYNGTDSFTYRANDGALNSNTATVSITINAVNDAPVATNDTFTASVPNLIILTRSVPTGASAPNVLTNTNPNGADSDVDSSTLTAVLVSGPSHASSFNLNSDGTFSYTTLAALGNDSFTYRVSDGTTFSNIATVTIIVPIL
jgi:VCBS repeat-containing protein